MTLIEYVEWQALYDDKGTLMIQGEAISAAEVVGLAGGVVRRATKAEEKEVMQRGGSPPLLS